MLWQCSIHCPGLSASMSTSTVDIGSTFTVSLRADPVTDHLERVAVQMDRVEHHRVVDDPQPQTLTLGDRDRRDCRGSSCRRCRARTPTSSRSAGSSSSGRASSTAGEHASVATQVAVHESRGPTAPSGVIPIVGRRSGAARPQDRFAGGVGLAFGDGDDRERTRAGGDDDVVALAHAEHDVVDLDRLHREPVGVGDGQPMPADRDPVRRCRSRR